jgi:hypothetical protein
VRAERHDAGHGRPRGAVCFAPRARSGAAARSGARGVFLRRAPPSDARVGGVRIRIAWGSPTDRGLLPPPAADLFHQRRRAGAGPPSGGAGPLTPKRMGAGGGRAGRRATASPKSATARHARRRGPAKTPPAPPANPPPRAEAPWSAAAVSRGRLVGSPPSCPVAALAVRSVSRRPFASGFAERCPARGGGGPRRGELGQCRSPLCERGSDASVSGGTGAAKPNPLARRCAASGRPDRGSVLLAAWSVAVCR